MQPDIFTIVACGESAKEWIPHGHSIGVNDAWKWGKPTDSLLVCNRPVEFGQGRLQTIINSKPETFYSHKSNWAYAFPNWKKINLCQWYGRLVKGQHYSSNTSPFIAMTLAYNLGAKDIILWGCDMMEHKIWNTGNPENIKEIKRHMELVEALKEQGVNVWLGKEGTAFDNLIPVYDSKTKDISEPEYIEYERRIKL